MRVLIFGLALLAAPAMAQTGNWAGSYGYDESLGRDGAGQGNAIGVQHVLRLSGRSNCRLTAQGYQTNEDIRCTAKPIEGGLQIAFLSYPDGGTRNRYGVERYKPGEPLFTLRGTPASPTTEWQSYRPNSGKAPGTYFRRR